jgi:hypothetical protein
MKTKAYAIIATLALFAVGAGLTLPGDLSATGDQAGTTGIDPNGIPGIDPHGIPGIDPHEIPGIDPMGIPGIDPH